MKSKIVKFLYFFLFLLWLASLWQKKSLPNLEQINPALLQEPIQTKESSLAETQFTYREKEYIVKPIADYELWGLVVSVNNIKAWYNFYHDKDSVNIKDICVIWGNNLKDNDYKDVKYKSGEWTCYVSWSGSYSGKFEPHALSNNHLLSDDESVRKTIKNMQIGDQVRIKGALSEYAPAGTDYFRGTSLSREDMGNNACETVFVKEAEIIKKRFPDWKLLNSTAKAGLLLLIFFNILDLFRKSRKISEEKPL